MKKFIEKIPVWAYTVMLMVAGSLAAIYTSSIYASLLSAYLVVSLLSPVFFILAVGAAYGGIMRLLMRIVYSVGDRVFFGLTKAVPDYNLRRLPISYNNFVRNIAFWLIVGKLVEAVCMSLLMYLIPVGYYLWQFVASVAMLACLTAGYLLIDKFYVPTWQSAKCYISLIIPSAVIYVIAIFL